MEIIIDTGHSEEVVPESRSLWSCGRNVAATGVLLSQWCYRRHRMVTVTLPRFVSYCNCLLFLRFFPLFRIFFYHCSYCRWQASRYFVASAISRTRYIKTYQYGVDYALVNKWCHNLDIHFIPRSQQDHRNFSSHFTSINNRGVYSYL